MPGSGRAEIYFIAAMMILIMILSVTAIYIFFKTYKKEMREKDEKQKAKVKRQNEETANIMPPTDH